MIPPSSADLKDTLRAVLACNADAWIEALRVLPRRQSACFELYYGWGKTQLEIGELLGISDRTVRSDLREALETIAARTSLLNSFPLLPLFPAGVPDDLLD